MNDENSDALPAESKRPLITPPTSGSISSEQINYWKDDLRYKRWSFRVSLVGFGLIVLTLGLNWYQSRRVNKSITANVQNAAVTQVTNLDRLFVEKPDLRPYFYDNIEIGKDHEKFPQVNATAELVLDVFDLVGTQSQSFGEYYAKPEAWDEWIIDMFATSPILRTKFDESQNWYDDKLRELRQKSETRLKENSQTKQSKLYH